MDLIQKFQSICSLNGDDTAIHVTSVHKDLEAPSPIQSNISRSSDTTTTTIGFSELNENCNLIASELYHRHKIVDVYRNSNKSSTTCNSTTDSINIPKSSSISGGVVILSSQPSPGEITSILACTKLMIPFIPLPSIHSHHGRMSQSHSRIKTVLEETKPHVAIVIVSIKPIASDGGGSSMEWDENRPAFCDDEGDFVMNYIDEHNETVRVLNDNHIHRIIIVNAKDGTMLGSSIYHDNHELIGGNITDGGFDTFLRTHVHSSNFKEDNQRRSDSQNQRNNDVAYILYTSGSTKPNKPKAVIQTYDGIYNRIKWQWKTFPFVQQQRIEHGYQSTMKMLQEDRIIDGSENHFDIDVGDVVMRRTPLSFVDSIAEIFGSLLAGVPLWCPLYHYDVDIGNLYSSSNIDEQSLAVNLSIMDMLQIASDSKIRITRMTCLPSQLSQTLSLIHDSTNNSYNAEFDQQRNKNKREDDSPHGQKQIICHQHWIHNLNVIVVSGEPCPLSLIKDFERTFVHHKALLINLYGQTESSGDVACMVVGLGGEMYDDNAMNRSRLEKSIVARFPSAQDFLWKEKNIILRGKRSAQNKDENVIHRLKQLLVPCGIPIDGHEFTIVKKNGDDELGCLYVEGIGVALGYLNNEKETSNNFNVLDACQKGQRHSISSNRRFNTMDLAFVESGLLYVVGRAPQNDEEASNDLTSLTMGKINGVAVHANELEASFSSAFIGALKENSLCCDEFNCHTFAATIAYANDESRRNHSESFIFIDASQLPNGLLEYSPNQMLSEIIDSNELNFKVESQDQALNTAFGNPQSMNDILKRTRSLMSSSEFTEYSSHPSMIPHHIFVVSSFPKNGAAGKIDKRALVNMAKAKISKNKVYRRKLEEVDYCDFSIQDIIEIYNETLNTTIDKNAIDNATFVELGGDSMIAIDAAHRIMKVVKLRKNFNTSDDRIVSGIDLFHYTIKGIHDIITRGRRGASQRSSKRQKSSNHDESSDVGSFNKLPKVSAFDLTDENKIEAAWKLPLLMCVDARPTEVTINDNESLGRLVVVGSQGGDFVIANATNGDVYCREKLEGKIEGQISYIFTGSSEKVSSQYKLFVPCYMTSRKNEQGVIARFGYVHAFDFKQISSFHTHCNDSYSLSKSWVYKTDGELKNKPAAFCFQDSDKQNRRRVVVATYDGSIAYLNADTGEVLSKIDSSDTGGAIHADPLISKRGNEVKVIVASSTWIGKISCLSVHEYNLTIDWQLESNTPIYSSPLLCNADLIEKQERLIIFGIDGSLRSIDLRSGKQHWKESVTSRPIFSSGIHIQLQNQDSIVFGCHDGLVRCVNTSDCKVKWAFDAKSALLARPLFISESKNIIVASSTGEIFSLDSKTGMENRSSLPLEGEIFSSPSSFNGKPNSVFIGCRDSYLYRIKI